jgi:nicotinamide-nucleotide amidase
LRIDRCTFFVLPGVPREYHRIMADSVIPRLTAAAGHAVLRSRALHCFGITESALDEVVSPIREAHPEVRFGFRTKFPENHLSLVALAADAATADANLARVEAACRAALGAVVYGADGVTFAQSVGEALAARGETIATAESCTGGLLGQLLTEVGGSSRWYAGGFVTYSNAMKESALGVSAELLRTHGAVSEPVVLAMAEAARARSGAAWAVSITGVAGPGGGTADKPVGTVWLARSGPGGPVSRLAQLRGDRAQVRQLAAFGALQLVREALAISGPGPR